MDSSGDARIGVPPARRRLFRESIAITVEHDVSPFGEHPHRVDVVLIERPERDSLRVWFTVRQRALLKLHDSKQEPLTVVAVNDLSV